MEQHHPSRHQELEAWLVFLVSGLSAASSAARGVYLQNAAVKAIINVAATHPSVTRC